MPTLAGYGWPVSYTLAIIAAILGAFLYRAAATRMRALPSLLFSHGALPALLSTTWSGQTQSLIVRCSPVPHAAHPEGAAKPCVHGKRDHQRRYPCRHSHHREQRDHSQYRRPVRRPQVPARHKPFESHAGCKNTLRALAACLPQVSRMSIDRPSVRLRDQQDCDAQRGLRTPTGQ